MAGAPARVTLHAPDGTERVLVGKGAFIAPAGSLVVMQAPGSGGHGPPEGRDPARLSADLLDGYVTGAAARRDYRADGEAGEKNV